MDACPTTGAGNRPGEPPGDDDARRRALFARLAEIGQATRRLGDAFAVLVVRGEHLTGALRALAEHDTAGPAPAAEHEPAAGHDG